MRNLKNIRFEELALPEDLEGKRITAAAFYELKSHYLCTLGPTADNPLIELVLLNTKTSEK